jgi:hypothetical protein
LAALFGVVAAPTALVVAFARDDPALPVLGRALHLAVALTGPIAAVASDGAHAATQRGPLSPRDPQSTGTVRSS